MDNVNYPRNDTYILIPAYKPDHLLIELLQKLKRKDFDIVVVNDGSGEEYQEVFKEAEKYAYVLVQNINRGKGAALRFGFTYVNLHQKKRKRQRLCKGFNQN